MGPTPAAPIPAGPTVRRDLAGPGCRTVGGCRRARTACTARRDRVRPAALPAGITDRGLPSRTTTRTAGAGPAVRHRAVTLSAGRDQDREAPVRAAPAGRAAPARVASVPAPLVREVLVREMLVREVARQGPARAGRA